MAPCGNYFKRSRKTNRAPSSTKYLRYVHYSGRAKQIGSLIPKDNLALVRIEHADSAQLTRCTGKAASSTDDVYSHDSPADLFTIVFVAMGKKARHHHEQSDPTLTYILSPIGTNL